MDDEILEMIAARRAAAGRPALSADTMRDIAEQHALKEDPTFDMVLHLITLPQAESL
ncbi:MAG: hypothetical protein AB7F22_34910 [Reyranella sp.]|uniref:hypothetical protein n=1 Tax=Reyranella sp. TaxID=1929291 RepID=UPI003D0F484A